MGRKSYGFEIKKEFVEGFKNKIAKNVQISMLQHEYEKEQQRRREAKCM